MPTEPKRPQSVTVCLGSGQPIVIEDARLVTLFWKLLLVSAEIGDMAAGRLTAHLGQRADDVKLELTKRV